MIKINNLHKRYRLGRNNIVDALNGISFEIKAKEMAALVGPSGSGKSTILNIVGGLDRDYAGEVLIDNKNLKSINKDKYRRNYVQTILQQFYLVPALTVSENITLPIKFGGQFSGKDLKQRLDHILEEVGLSDRRNHKPSELSGGQIQRVAVARALITNPDIILADEPTGNLDSKTGGEIIDLLFKINETEGTAMIIITHDMEIIKDVKHKIYLKDGLVEKEDK